MPLSYDISYEPNFMHFCMWTTFLSGKWLQILFFKNFENWQHCILIFNFQHCHWFMALHINQIWCILAFELNFGHGSESKFHFSKISKSGNTAHNSLSCIYRWCPAVDSFKFYICHWFMACFWNNFACHFAVSTCIIVRQWSIHDSNSVCPHYIILERLSV